MPLGPEQQEIIEQLPTVSLEKLDQRASLLRRTDTKYVLTADSFAELLNRLSSDHEVLEIDKRRRFRYQSVYFDTADLLCFHDHVEDHAPRFKARTRSYVDTGTCVFEVKLKRADGATDKRQIPYSSTEGERITEDAVQCLREALADADLQSPEQPLEPSLRTSFTRITLSPAQGKERTTCDLDIRLERPRGRSARLRDGMVVVETKSERGDSPTDTVLADLGVEPTSLSKYRTGVALLVSEARDPDSPRTAERLFELD